MKERQQPSITIINWLGNSILRSLVSDLKKSQPVISWQEFINLKLKINLGDEIYGLNLSNSPEAMRDFLEVLIRARISEDEEQ